MNKYIKMIDNENTDLKTCNDFKNAFIKAFWVIDGKDDLITSFQSEIFKILLNLEKGLISFN